MLDHLAGKMQPDIQYIEATVCPGNLASCAFFESYAAWKKAPVTKKLMFASGLFEDDGHEEEYLVSIGPL